MFRNLLLALLLALVFASPEEYFISPPIPPTAFVGEFYTVQFRVLGLDNPVFKFEDLPLFFKGYSDGTLEGIPATIGSYSIKVWFASKGVQVCKVLTIRVSASVSSINKVATEAGVTQVNDFIVVSPKQSLTYLVGDKIELTLSTQHGQSPYKWDYLNLPSELVGNADGVIRGVFQQEGYYSFSCNANDANGQFADSYFTVNVQPRESRDRALIEVPNRNVAIRYDLKQVATQQVASTNAVYAAIKVVSDRKVEAEAFTAALGKATLALQFATQQEAAAQANANEKLTTRKLAAVAENKASEVLESAAKVVALQATNVKNAIADTKRAVLDLAHAQEVLHDADIALQRANNVFINAQTETAQSAQNAKAALSLNLNARNVYNLSFGELTDKKKLLQVALDQKARADIVVGNARNALSVINQANDDAIAALTIAQKNYEQAYSALDNANRLVSKIRAELVVADNQLGVAKFNFLQALNNLYVAQARKAQADKATTIVRLQTATLPAEESTNIFAGCAQEAYPTVSGSAYIRESNGRGYALGSGSVLVFGDCTVKEQVIVGDCIEYDGYIKDGYVHAISYKKATVPK